ncbi:ATP-binding cassette domain-containing protein [Butyrivibrio sp. AE2032]|uniref:ATP-binding cassette domain-containing protein n=1 Tax=Butyrivibrio sp. AE2032 TaxID=1458463 RepID=UPI00068A8BD0|nr:ABC transporter ATP-binding protein [Butyrivibrio sp. AE2032]
MPRHIHIVKVHHLTLSFPTRKDPNPKPVLDDVDFGIRDGEILGLIGNSGSGKTMTSLAIAGLLPESARITSGSIKFAGNDLLEMAPKERRAMLGRDIGMIFQEPSTALDPLMTCGKQLDEVLTAHKDKAGTPEERHKAIVEMLGTVGFTNAEEICGRYPHQLSGGQRQRVLIAGAALLKPRLLICDEPTSSLDTVTTVSILALLKDLCHKLHMTILFISHDLSAVRGFCDRVMVMKDGKIIDRDTASDILTNPRNSYTAELLTNSRLDTRILGLEPATVDYSRSPVLTAKDITAGYGRSLFERVKNKKQTDTNVLHNVSLEVFPNEILGLIGGSGSGKTTLIRSLLGLLPHSGTVNIKSSSIGAIFQDPVSCLNPAHTIRWHMLEALKASGRQLSSEPGSRAERRSRELARITAVLEECGLGAGYLSRRPNELSGGQRQRVAIAMCLIQEPALIIADEPFSSLDASSSAELLKLMTDINRERHTAFLLITHNIHIVRQIAPRLIVLHNGEICEEGPTREVLGNPKSESTARLLEAERSLHGL